MDNIEIGILFINRLLLRYDYNYVEAIQHYYGGRYRTAETRKYYEKVLHYWDLFEQSDDVKIIK